MENEILAFIRKYLVSIGLLFFVSLIFTDSLFVPAVDPATKSEKTCISEGNLSARLKLSEISGPQIDGGAASISCEKKVSFGAVSILPVKIWILLLLSYLALLVFNLAYDFKKDAEIHWVWEMILTGIYVLMWSYFDQSSLNTWFPLYIIKLGIVVYFIYLYFFEKKNK